MAKIYNTTARPYYLSVSGKDFNGILVSKSINCVPGKHTEISKEDLGILKEQIGFKRYLKEGSLSITGEKETDEDKTEDAVEISAAAKKLADENDIDVSTLEPNEKGNITVDIVKDAIAALEL